jgi:hypothetical protein
LGRGGGGGGGEDEEEEEEEAEGTRIIFMSVQSNFKHQIRDISPVLPDDGQIFLCCFEGYLEFLRHFKIFLCSTNTREAPEDGLRYPGWETLIQTYRVTIDIFVLEC